MKFSVITINYNNATGLGHTIDSVISQTCTDFEFIVIDGGSTDSSIDIINSNATKIDLWLWFLLYKHRKTSQEMGSNKAR